MIVFSSTVSRVGSQSNISSITTNKAKLRAGKCLRSTLSLGGSTKKKEIIVAVLLLYRVVQGKPVAGG